MEQTWQKIDTRAGHDDLEWAVVEGEDSEEWECVACNKSFRSEAAWDSHERSKKHIKEVERLRQEMMEEGEILGLDEEKEAGIGITDVPSVSLRSPSPVNIQLPSPPSDIPVSELVPEYDEDEQSLPRSKKGKKSRNTAKSNIESQEPLTKTEKKKIQGVLEQFEDSSSSRCSPVGEKISTVDSEDHNGLESGDGSGRPEITKRDLRRARQAKKAEAMKAEASIVGGHICLEAALLISVRRYSATGRDVVKLLKTRQSYSLM